LSVTETETLSLCSIDGFFEIHVKQKMKKLILILIAGLIFISCKQESATKDAQQPETPVDYAFIKTALDSIHTEDQKYRTEIREIDEKYGWESEEMKNHLKIMRAVDSSNLIIVEEILDKYGWLSSEQIGRKANKTLFLVIQHADQETWEKYLPVMRQAVKDGKAKARSLALLEDRTNLGRGELQIYGSQIKKDQETGEMYVMPLTDPDKVNERRASVGLRPIEDYIKSWDLEWDVEEYKRNLPKRIEQLKASKK